jgi:hypothetical protein
MSGLMQRIHLLYEIAQPCFILIEWHLRFFRGGELRIILIIAGFDEGIFYKNV